MLTPSAFQGAWDDPSIKLPNQPHLQHKEQHIHSRAPPSFPPARLTKHSASTVDSGDPNAAASLVRSAGLASGQVHHQQSVQPHQRRGTPPAHPQAHFASTVDSGDPNAAASPVGSAGLTLEQRLYRLRRNQIYPNPQLTAHDPHEAAPPSLHVQVAWNDSYILDDLPAWPETDDSTLVTMRDSDFVSKFLFPSLLVVLFTLFFVFSGQG